MPCIWRVYICRSNLLHEADAAVELVGGERYELAGAAAECLGDGDLAARGQALVEPRDRLLRREHRAVAVDGHVGAVVLHGLQRADGASELHAHLDVIDGALQYLLGHARHLHTGQRGRGIQRAPQVGPSAADLAYDVGGGHEGVVEGDL